ncbi:MAG: fumarylacetoacetate hydrolase family protein [Sandaracinaceae bacterium]|jgi:fumarylacetoacetate (FAA) hydrolase|nr:fumarylacetoacetate hydrolase family protein [Sandaracinaceae bacterium]
MKLATLRDGSRDGILIVVRKDGNGFTKATGIAKTMQLALDTWDESAPKLLALAADLEASRAVSEPLDVRHLHSPLPRAYEWVDGSAYIHHIVLVRKARGAEPPETLMTDPLVYQGGSGVFLGPTEDIPLVDESWGLDFEAEVCVVLGDTPQGTKKEDAHKYIRLFMLANDITLRNLIPPELAKGFGFFQSKPATAFSPFAVTPDELGDALRDGRVHLRLRSTLNGTLAGDPEAGPEMHFSFHDLIAHLARTRSYTAGTIVGSGTVSNVDSARGVSCLAERRTRETLEGGKPVTPFMKPNDRIEIEMLNAQGASIFGRIAQKVVARS